MRLDLSRGGSQTHTRVVMASSSFAKTSTTELSTKTVRLSVRASSPTMGQSFSFPVSVAFPSAEGRRVSWEARGAEDATKEKTLTGLDEGARRSVDGQVLSRDIVEDIGVLLIGGENSEPNLGGRVGGVLEGSSAGGEEGKRVDASV